MAEQLGDMLATLCILAVIGRTMHKSNKAYHLSETQTAARQRSIRRAAVTKPIARHEQKAQHGT